MTDILVADIGGTGSRLAVFRDGQQAIETVTYTNSEHACFEEILDNFLMRLDQRPGMAALAVAGPVIENSVHMTNLGWQLSGSDLAARFALQRVEFINDFAAVAWATLALTAEDILSIGSGIAKVPANRGVLGPGTGLGVSGLIHNAAGWAVVAGEGGHVSLASASAAEAELIAQVREEFGHCSAERLLCGAGLARIHQYVSGACMQPEEVTALALKGDSQALQTIEMFSLLFGTVASDLALTLGARGGIYIAGGILPAIADLFAASGFRERFEQKGRFERYLAAIPTVLIRTEYPSFKGLDLYMRQLTARQSILPEHGRVV